MNHNAPKRQTIRGRVPNGARIQELRINRGWSVEKLAEKADLVPATVQSLERGEGIKLLSTFASVAKALEVSPSELYAPDTSEPLLKGQCDSNEQLITITIKVVTISIADIDENKPLPKIVRDIFDTFGGDDSVANVRTEPSSSVLLHLEASEIATCAFLERFCAGYFYPDIDSITCTDTAGIRTTIAIALKNTDPYQSERSVDDYERFLSEWHVDWALLEMPPGSLLRLEVTLEPDAGIVHLAMHKYQPDNQELGNPRHRRNERDQPRDD